jgi:two-component system phosphate regulon sensor histidine kinase PhoR
MRSSSRELAIYISIILTVLFALSMALFIYFDFKNIYLVAAIELIFFFGIIYLLISNTLVGYIAEKIQPVYKTIHDFSLSQHELKQKVKSRDFISMVNREVEDWADKKSKEIKKLKQLEKYRKDFVGNVSHELKTPIFNIQGYVLTLLDGGLEDPSINRLYLERTEKSINRMISIVEDLESISRLESGEVIPHVEEFDMVKLVEEVFEMLEIRAKQKSIKLSFASSYNKPIKVKADRKRMHEVLNNLLLNSILYGKKNGKTTVSFMNMGNNLLVDVSDNGIGISEEDIPRIFERFYRTDKSRSRDMGGTGLGLAIVKHIIEAHNQTINVKSKVEKGSTFVFTMEKA